MQTFAPLRVFTDALPRICKGKKCLNTAEKDIDLCLSCLRDKGLSDNDIKAYCLSVKKKRTPAPTRILNPLGVGLEEDQIIYFIQSGNGGPIKIGVTGNVLDRLIALQTANPIELKLIATIAAPPALEFQLHAYFDEHRMMGEWFQPVGEVLEFAKLLNQGNLEEILDRFEARIAANN